MKTKLKKIATEQINRVAHSMSLEDQATNNQNLKLQYEELVMELKSKNPKSYGKTSIMYQYPEGATRLDPDEASGLIPNHIRTTAEPNEWEQNNILEAEKWSFARKKKDILSIEFIKRLHQKMFDKTWDWAGSFRRSNKNIGVDWHLINA